MTVEEIRKMFPALEREVYGRKVVYFDNAATSQRTQDVIDVWNDISLHSNANIHRAVHKMADETTQAYEEARESVRQFINASSREEIIFTSGTTASINLVAFCFGEAFVREGDEIVVTEAEHHSDIVPWQLMCLRKGAVLKAVKVSEDGTLNPDSVGNVLSDKTKIVAITHISNVLGVVNPVREVIAMCHSKGIPVLVDGAQGIVHEKVDVRKLDCDFYAFSGHKMYAATGTGVLYGKKSFLDRMPPYMGGGEMVGTVTIGATTYAPLPMKYEAGTQNFASVPTLKKAVEFMKLIDTKEIKQHEASMRDYLWDELSKRSNIRIFGNPSDRSLKIPLFSFAVDGVHHEDLALILDKMGIAVRSGQMCAEPLMDRFGVSGMLRLSLAPYNTMEECEYFVRSLDKAVGMLV